MTVQIEDSLRKLRRKAEARGLTLERYLADLAEGPSTQEHPTQEPPPQEPSAEEPAPNVMTVDEFLRRNPSGNPPRAEGDWPHIGWTPERWAEWKRWRSEFNERVKMGPIPEGATSFESLYESED